MYARGHLANRLPESSAAAAALNRRALPDRRQQTTRRNQNNHNGQQSYGENTIIVGLRQCFRDSALASLALLCWLNCSSWPAKSGGSLPVGLSQQKECGQGGLRVCKRPKLCPLDVAKLPTGGLATRQSGLSGSLLNSANQRAGERTRLRLGAINYAQAIVLASENNGRQREWLAAR